jgi:uncharacterized protein (TIGR03067 family)
MISMCLLVAMAALDDGKNAAIKKDLDQLQGEWRIVWAERDGKRVDADASAGVLVIKENKWLRTSGEVIAEFTIDPTTNPKCIDVTFLRDEANGKKVEGIYKFEDGMFIRCTNGVSDLVKERPSAFSTKPGSGLAVYACKKSKPS